MVDLHTRWLGMDLASPLVVGASPITDDVDTARRVVDAGAGALVLRSVFEEEILAEQLAFHHHVDRYADFDAEASSFIPDLVGPADPLSPVLSHLERVASAVGVPVLASLNGVSPGGWVSFARRLVDAGAAAIELNLYDVPSRLDEPGSVVEARQLEIVRAVVLAAGVPVTAKLSPFYSSLPAFVAALQEAGAAGAVLFNRFFQPDLDLDQMTVELTLSRSSTAELPLRLHGLALLHGRVALDLAATGGVHRGTDVAKAIACGAHVVQVVSGLLDDPAAGVARMLGELSRWLDDHRFVGPDALRGLAALDRVTDPSAWERLNYSRMLDSWPAIERRAT